MNLTEYAKEMGISKPSALDHVRRLQWETKDGRRFQSSKTLVKGKTVWSIQEQSGIQGGEKSLEDLKKEKMAEEIAILQQRNREMEENRFRAWCDCLTRASERAAMKYASVPLSLRVDKKNSEILNNAIKEVFTNISDYLAEELNDWREKNK